jgi:hypothetical protein
MSATGEAVEGSGNITGNAKPHGFRRIRGIVLLTDI